MSYTVGNLISNYTSAKFQRLNLRKDNELNLFSVTEAQRDYSSGLEGAEQGYTAGMACREGSTSLTNCGVTSASDFQSGISVLPILWHDSG